jgi:formate dehydrogenase major subunit
VRTFIEGWPAFRQLKGDDPLGRGSAVKSAHSATLQPRVRSADKVVKSVCPFCAVGCGQNVYVEGDKVSQIEGDPDSPVSRGRLCPKGSASLQLTTGSSRLHEVLYRAPHAKDWESLDLDTAMDMIADRVIETRKAHWQDEVGGKTVNRTMGFTALGAIQIENQARV